MTEMYPDTAREPLWTGREDYQVLRSDVTGAGHYRFFRKDEAIGSASALVLPDWPLVIRSGALVLNSSFEQSRTIFPGCSRDIIDADNPADVLAKIVYLDTGSFQLQANFSTGSQCLQIRSGEKTHLFLRDGEPIARITPPVNPRRDGEWETRYCMESLKELPQELALLMLSFPLLRFAL